FIKWNRPMVNCCHGEQYKNMPVNAPIESWQTYRNGKLGFELKYPPNWHVANESPEAVIFADGAGGSIRILPQGEPKDGRYELSVPSDVAFSEPASVKVDYVTTDKERYATYIKVDHIGKDTWDESGMIEANAALENPAPHCIRKDAELMDISKCDVEIGDLYVYNGKVNTAERNTIKTMLSTFRFVSR
ncbi:MAG: hypothetical protein JWO73_184, partial [Candidatus Taylorbacteria bacterium]|nr:hypothetical protein [Candidatus Taylorbacteria bacterium]